jgi:hypothetical protein
VQRGQEQRHGQQHRNDLAHEQAVGVDRRAEAHALRQPLAHGGGHDRLHERHAHRHHDGGGEEHGVAAAQAAQRRPGRHQQQAADQRRTHAQARHQQRTEQGRDREQRRRDAAQEADLGGTQPELVADHRDDRRHGEDRQPQRVAGQPEQRDRRPQIAPREALGVGHGSATGGRVIGRRHAAAAKGSSGTAHERRFEGR